MGDSLGGSHIQDTGVGPGCGGRGGILVEEAEAEAEAEGTTSNRCLPGRRQGIRLDHKVVQQGTAEGT